MLELWLPKLNIKNGLINFEARCRPAFLYKNENVSDQEFLMPIEINLRAAGGENWAMTKAAFDVDIIKEHLNICLGIHLDDNLLKFKYTNPRNACASLDIHPAKNILYKSLFINFEKLEKSEETIEVALFRGVGDKLGVYDDIGWLAIKNEYDEMLSEERLISKLHEIYGAIKFEFV
jgi:biotin carboxylase